MKKIKAKKINSNGIYTANTNEIKKVLDILHIDKDDCTLGKLREHIDFRETTDCDCYILIKEIKALNYAWKNRNEKKKHLKTAIPTKTTI